MTRGTGASGVRRWTTPSARRASLAVVMAAGVLVGGTAVTSGFVLADASTPPSGSGDSLDAQAAQLKQQLKTASGDLDADSAATKTAAANLADTETRLAAATHALASAQGILAGATGLADATRTELAAAQAAVTASAKAVAGAQVELTVKERAVGAYARAAYEDGPTSLVTGFLSATDPGQIAESKVAQDRQAEALHGAVLSVDGARITLAQQQAELTAQRNAVASKLATLEKAEAAAKTATDDAAQAQTQVTALAQQQTVALKTAQNAETSDKAKYATLQQSSDQIEKLIQAREAAAASAAASASAAAASSSAAAAAAAAAGTSSGTASSGGGTAVAPTAPEPTVGSSGLLWPVNGVISSGFGYRVDPVTGANIGFHPGVDIAAPIGTPIHAAQTGTVIYAGWEEGYGNYTCIDHGGGFSTCYGHQSKIDVTVGQSVVRGQLIGLVGSTGYSTGPHCHFETRVNGVPVDPMKYF